MYRLIFIAGIVAFVGVTWAVIYAAGELFNSRGKNDGSTGGDPPRDA